MLLLSLQPRMYFEHLEGQERRFAFHNDREPIVRIDANTGAVRMKSALKLEKLSCVLAASGSEEVSLEGNVLVYRFPADSLEQVAAAIERTYYVIPPA